MRLVIVFVWLFFIVSWFTNLYEITKCDFETPYKSEALHIIAIPVAPLSMFTAWADLGK